MLHAVIFDNDGTVTDSVPITVLATNQALSDGGFPTVSEVDVVDGMRIETILRMMKHAGTADRKIGAALASFYYARMEPLLASIPLFPGITDCLSSLHKAGIPLGMVSNNHSDIISRVLKSNGILDMFAVLIGENNAVQTKPAPGGLLQACRDLNVSPENVIYVGDSLSDAMAARDAGIRSVGVTWNSHDPVDIETLGFTETIDEPGELLKFLS